jgi:hypothetical protein
VFARAKNDSGLFLHLVEAHGTFLKFFLLKGSSDSGEKRFAFFFRHITKSTALDFFEDFCGSLAIIKGYEFTMAACLTNPKQKCKQSHKVVYNLIVAQTEKAEKRAFSRSKEHVMDCFMISFRESDMAMLNVF